MIHRIELAPGRPVACAFVFALATTMLTIASGPQALAQTPPAPAAPAPKATPKAAPKAAPKHVAPTLFKAKFASVKDYDPYGDNKQETPNQVREAIDGNPHTYWATEHYSGGLNKPGVGLWVKTTQPVTGKQLDLISPFAGWQGMVYAVNGPPPANIKGWTKVSPPFSAASTNKVPLNTRGQAFDHYLVWITKLAGQQAGIMEISLLAQKR